MPRLVRHAIAAAAAGLLLLAAVPAAAQRQDISIGPDTLAAGGVFFSGGPAFTPFDRGTAAPAWLGQAGLTFRPLSGLELRLGGIYWQRRRTLTVDPSICAPDCAQMRLWWVGGGLLEAAVDLRRSSRVRPFLSAGAGGVQSTARDRFNFECELTSQTCARLASPTRLPATIQRRPSALLTGGAGVELRAGPLDVLGEVRVLWRATPGVAAPATVVPLTLGVRF